MACAIEKGEITRQGELRTIGCGEVEGIANEGVLRGSVLSFLVFGGGFERKQVEPLRGKTMVEQGVQTDVAMVIDVVFCPPRMLSSLSHPLVKCAWAVACR